MNKIAVAAYCRVSSKDKDQLQSLENQQSYFNREFGDNEIYELYRVYADEGKSGTKLSRPAFDEMILAAGIDKSRVVNDLYAIIGEPKFRRILVKNTSRFARNVSVDMLIKTLSKNGVFIDFIDTNLSTERATDNITLGVLQLLDQEESRDKSRKVQFGIKEGIKRGNIHVHGNLYGYKYYPKPENRLEIIESEAETIRLIFDLYVNQGYGIHRISNYLTERNILTRLGKPFGERTLRIMIENEHYTGRGVRQKFTTGLVFNKHNSKKTGKAQIFDTDKIPPIIDIDTFNKAQEILANRVQHKTQKGIYDGKTDYAGKIICGACGAKYSASNSDYLVSAGRKVRCYTCTSKRKYVFLDQLDKDGKPIKVLEYDEKGKRKLLCYNPNIYETKLDEALESDNYNFLLFNNLIGAILYLKELRQTIQFRMSNTNTDDIEALQGQKKALEASIQRVTKLVISGSLTEEQAQEALNPTQAELTVINERLELLIKPHAEKQRDIAELTDTINALEKRRSEIYVDEEVSDKTKQHYTRTEILADVAAIIIGHTLDDIRFIFKSFEEVQRIVDKFAYLLPDEQKERFSRLAELGMYSEIMAEYQSERPSPTIEGVVAELREHGAMTK